MFFINIFWGLGNVNFIYNNKIFNIILSNIVVEDFIRNFITNSKLLKTLEEFNQEYS